MIMEQISNINVGKNYDESIFVWLKILYLALDIGIRRELGDTNKNK